MLYRLFIWTLLLGATLVGGVIAMNQGSNETLTTLWNRYIDPEGSSLSMERLQIELVDQLNHVRLADQQAWLKRDPELTTWLQAKLDAGVPTENLSRLCEELVSTKSRYLDVSASVATGTSNESIKIGFHQYLQDFNASKMTHIAFGERKISAGLSMEVVMMTVQRLRDFSPELLHRTTDDAFVARCPHCKVEHSLRAMRGQSSSTLECPSCKKIYAMIAADTQGKFHYVNEFLRGYQPNAIYPKGQSRIEQLFAVWAAVHSSCAYTRDPGEKKQQTDRWQTAIETQTLGKGDCEDSAIFLADWLIALGFEARVALGKYGDIGGHAWCVVRVDDREYLLESTTEGHPDFDRPPLASRVGSRYVPEVMFDRWSLYVRTAPQQPWNGDYWADNNWIKVEPRAMASSDPLANREIGSAYQAQPISVSHATMDSSRMAYVKPLEPHTAPFRLLSRLSQSSDEWRVQVPPPLWDEEH